MSAKKQRAEMKKFIMQVVKSAEARDLLDELAVYMNYFSSHQRLMELTGGKESTLRALELITPAKNDPGVQV